MKKVVALLLLAATVSCGESQPTQRARLHDPLAENEALLLVFPTETNIPPNAPQGDTLPPFNYAKLELF